MAAFVVTWVLGFGAAEKCSANVGSVTRREFGGLATPCELVNGIGFLAFALIVVLTVAAFVLALRDRLWFTLAAMTLAMAVPLLVAFEYGQGHFN